MRSEKCHVAVLIVRFSCRACRCVGGRTLPSHVPDPVAHGSQGGQKCSRRWLLRGRWSACSVSARYRFGHGIPQNCEAVIDARDGLTDPMLLAVARMVQAESVECPEKTVV